MEDELDGKQLIKRYKQLSPLSFGEQVSFEMKCSCLFDLLPYETAFADSQSSIGNVTAFPFTFTVADTRPLYTKAIPYPPEACSWLKQECKNLLAKGVIEEVKLGQQEPLFTCNIVLVRAGQTGQDYCMCYNGIPVNARTCPSHRYVPDCATVLDELHSAAYLSLIDLKGAFLNIPCNPAVVPYLGFVT